MVLKGLRLMRIRCYSCNSLEIISKMRQASGGNLDLAFGRTEQKNREIKLNYGTFDPRNG